MAAGDFRLRSDFFGHLKTKALRRSLGAAGVEALLALWAWVSDPSHRRTSGDLSGLSDDELELAVDWAGEPGALVRELARLRWLDGEPGARRVHDWAEHQPWAVGAEARVLAAKEAAGRRWGRRNPAPESLEEMRAACAEHAPSMRAAMPSACAGDAPDCPTARLPLKEEESATRSAHAREAEPVLLDVAPEPGPGVATPERVFAAYSATLPPAGWTLHRRLTRDLRAKLAARIREVAERRELAWWTALFERIAVRVTWPSTKTLDFLVRTDGQLQGFVDGGRDDREPPACRPAAHPPSVAQQLFAKAAALDAGLDAGPDPLAGVMLTLPTRRQGYVGRAPPASVDTTTLELFHGEAPGWAPGGDA